MGRQLILVIYLLEVWKCLKEGAAEFLTRMFNKIFEGERIPNECGRGKLSDLQE